MGGIRYHNVFDRFRATAGGGATHRVAALKRRRAILPKSSGFLL